MLLWKQYLVRIILKETSSEIPLRDYYTKEDVKHISYKDDLGDPSYFPFTRGKYKTIRWIIRNLAGEKTPAETNNLLKHYASKGQMAIDVIGDAPTMAYIDSDHPLAEASVGSQGVPLCSRLDYQEMLNGVQLGEISLSYSVPSIFAIAGSYIMAKEGKIPSSSLRGSTILLPLYCESCGYATRQPVEMRIRLAVDTIEFCTKEMPNFYPFCLDTYYISEVALNSIEEIALGIIVGKVVIREALKRGLNVDDFAHRIVYLTTSQDDFFEQVAKCRALRRLWAKMMKREFGAKNSRSLALTTTVHTSGLSLTAQQPVNNIVRGAFQALASVLGGCQAIEISCFDEPYRTPSREAGIVAMRSQQIIFCETGAANVTDPLGGSYYIEYLTSKLQQEISDYVMKIEEKGDPIELAKEGFFQKIFENAIERYSKKIMTGERKKVGVNVFQIPLEEDTLLRETVESKFQVATEQIEKIEKFKKARDKYQVREALNQILQNTPKQKNLTPLIIEAMKKGATMEEVTGAIRLGYDSGYDPFQMREADF